MRATEGSGAHGRMRDRRQSPRWRTRDGRRPPLVYPYTGKRSARSVSMEIRMKGPAGLRRASTTRARPPARQRAGRDPTTVCAGPAVARRAFVHAIWCGKCAAVWPFRRANSADTASIIQAEMPTFGGRFAAAACAIGLGGLISSSLAACSSPPRRVSGAKPRLQRSQAPHRASSAAPPSNRRVSISPAWPASMTSSLRPSRTASSPARSSSSAGATRSCCVRHTAIARSCPLASR